jgi:hypothetical protein
LKKLIGYQGIYNCVSLLAALSKSKNLAAYSLINLFFPRKEMSLFVCKGRYVSLKSLTKGVQQTAVSIIQPQLASPKKSIVSRVLRLCSEMLDDCFNFVCFFDNNTNFRAEKQKRIVKS